MSADTHGGVGGRIADAPRRLLRPGRWPRLDGRRVLITGATGGLGFFAARGLARLGADLVLAARNPEKAALAEAALRADTPGVGIEHVSIDTSSLDSVARAAESVAQLAPIDALVNNAGLIAAALRRRESVDGFEATLATNTIGHFALAARILPRITAGGRIVWLGSVGTNIFRPTMTDPQLRGGYSLKRAYTQSKLAGHLAAFEWERRRRAAGHEVASLIAHPGYAVSGLSERVTGVNEPGLASLGFGLLTAVFVGAHSKVDGAESEIAAVADPAVRGGDFLGPRWWMRGEPTLQHAYAPSYDRQAAARMWRNLVAWTGVEPDFAAPSPTHD